MYDLFDDALLYLNLLAICTWTLLLAWVAEKRMRARWSWWWRLPLWLVMATAAFFLVGLAIASFDIGGTVDVDALLERFESGEARQELVAVATTLLAIVAVAVGGMAATWIALGTHLRWFVRAALTTGVFAAALLQLPAFGLLAVLAIQLSVGAGAVVLMTRGRVQAGHGETVAGATPWRLQFSLVDLLAVATGAAVVMGIVAAAARNEIPLLPILVIGASCGLCVLVAYVCLVSAQPRLIRLGLFVSGSWSLGFLAEAVWWQWEYDLTGYFEGLVVRWSGFFLVAATLVALWMKVARSAGVLTCPIASVRVRPRWGRVRFAMVTIALLLPIAAVYFSIYRPTPMPQVKFPDPNGYELLLPVVDRMQDVGPDDALVMNDEETRNWWIAFAEENRELLDEARSALRFSGRVTLDLSPGAFDLNFDRMLAFRALARALRGDACRLERDGRWADAAEAHFDCLELGQVMAPGGLMLDQLVAMAVDGIACRGLYELIGNLTPEECRALTDRLQATDEPWDSLEVVAMRERIFFEHTEGWRARLRYRLEPLVPVDAFSETWYSDAVLRNRTIRRLLATELALHIYRAERGEWPASLDALVPDYLPEVPLDPFSDAPLIYRLAEDQSEYLLYSINVNRVDDGGVPGALPIDGDLILADYFSDEEDDEDPGTVEESATPKN